MGISRSKQNALKRLGLIAAGGALLFAFNNCEKFEVQPTGASQVQSSPSLGTPVQTPDAVVPAPTPTAPSLPVLPFKLGVYASPPTKNLPPYEAWLGRKLDLVLETIPSETWEHMVESVPWGAFGYFASTTKGYETKTVVTIPMIPTFAKYDGPTLSDGENSQALADCAAGANDARWVEMSKAIANQPLYRTSIIRLGWEANGNWYNWRANVNPTAWKACYRRIVGILRANDNLHLTFDWTVAGQRQNIPAEQIYPGDDVVDIVGVDMYDTDWSRYNGGAPATPAVQAEVWDKTVLNGDHGLTWYTAFSKAHGKPLHIDEWGLIPPSGHGGGDNTLYVQNMWNYAINPDSNVKALLYFNSPAIADFPKSAALYKKLVGQYAP